MKYTVNYHFIKWCNYSCGFCFARFEEQKSRFELEPALKVISKLVDSQLVDRINFVGGEPTLQIEALLAMLKFSKENGLKTSIVTNGSMLLEQTKKGETILDLLCPYLDVIGLSIDSLYPETNKIIGRVGKIKDGVIPDFSFYYKLVNEIQSRGLVLKINTTVNRFNLDEDFARFVFLVRPTRWKIFQVKPVIGQNDKDFARFEITDREYKAWIDKNVTKDLDHLSVAEDNDLMNGSYLMINPDRKLYSDTSFGHKYSRLSLDSNEACFEELLEEVGFVNNKYLTRDGGWYQIPASS